MPSQSKNLTNGGGFFVLSGFVPMIFEDKLERIVKIRAGRFDAFTFGKNIWKLLKITGVATFWSRFKNSRQFKTKVRFHNISVLGFKVLFKSSRLCSRQFVQFAQAQKWFSRRARLGQIDFEFRHPIVVLLRDRRAFAARARCVCPRMA